MRRRSSNHTTQRLQHWYRALGRLHRIASMRHLRQPDDDRDQRASPHTPPLSPAPTDPEVFAGPSRPSTQRPPTPHPSPVYDIPQPSVPSTITPTSDLIRDILSEIGDDPGMDVAGNSDMRPRPTEDAPPPPYQNLKDSPGSPSSSPCSLVEGGYINMAPQTATTSSRRTPTSVRVPHREPNLSFEGMADPLNYTHRSGERVIPIPQGSPPLRPPVNRPVPAYYRDYINPDVFPAYFLICHYAWYVQISADIIICAACATSEHTFCIINRPMAVWRHLHVISRTFEHTSMHCGRCYKLLINTRRAIDCYDCRQRVIETRGRTERLVYKVICETCVPRGII